MSVNREVALYSVAGALGLGVAAAGVCLVVQKLQKRVKVVVCSNVTCMYVASLALWLAVA